MIGRWGLVLALLVLTGAALIDLGLATALIPEADAPARALALFDGIAGPAPRLVLAAREAMQQAGMAAVLATLAGTSAGCAGARLSRPAASVLRALVRLPALTVLVSGLLAGTLLVGATGPVVAALAAFDVAAGRLGGGAGCAVVLAPLLAVSVGHAAARLDRATFEALATLGVGPVRRLLFWALPTVLPAAIRAGVLGFCGIAVALLLRAWPVAARQENVAQAVARLDQPALWALAFCAALGIAVLLGVLRAWRAE